MSGNLLNIPLEAGVPNVPTATQSIAAAMQAKLQANQNYQFQAQRVAGQVYQNSLNPDGTVDFGKLKQGLASHPITAIMSPEAVANAYSANQSNVGLASSKLGLQSGYFGKMSDILSGIEGQKATGDEAKKILEARATAAGIPSGIIAQAYNNIPDGTNIDSSLNGLARTFGDQVAQTHALASTMAGQINQGGQGELVINKPAGTGFTLGQPFPMTMAPQPVNTMNQNYQPTVSIMSTGGAPPQQPTFQGGVPQAPQQAPVTNAGSMVPVPGGQVPAALAGPQGAQGNAGGQAPTQAPAEQAPPPGALSTNIQPTGMVTGLSQSESDYVKNVATPLASGYEETLATAPVQLASLDKLENALGNANSGPWATQFQKIRGTLAEFTGIGASAAGQYDTAEKLMAQIAQNGLPSNLGQGTDFKLQLQEAAGPAMDKTVQGNQNVIAYSKGIIQAQMLAAHLAQEAGLINNTGNQVRDLPGFLQNVTSHINPSVPAYMAMDAQNKKDFIRGMDPQELAQFTQDYNFYNGLLHPGSQVYKAFASGQWEGLSGNGGQ